MQEEFERKQSQHILQYYPGTFLDGFKHLWKYVARRDSLRPVLDLNKDV